MKSSGRMKLYMSMGLAIFLMVQLIVFWAVQPGKTGMVLIVFGTTVLLAVGAVSANWYAMKRIQQRVAQLPEAFRTFYIDANEAIALTSIKKIYKKDTMDMILEILEHANQEGRTLESITGGDSESFITGFVTASGGRLTPLYLFGYSLTAFMLYLFTIKLYKVFRHGTGTLEDIQLQTLDVGIVLTYALIGFVFMPWIFVVMQKAASNQWQGLKRFWVVLPLSIPLGLMALLIFIEPPALRTFLDRPLPIMGSPILMVLCLLITIAGWLIAAYARRRELQRSLNS